MDLLAPLVDTLDKRHFTPQELDFLLNDLPTPTKIIPTIRKVTKEIVIHGYRKQLSRWMVYPSILPKLKEIIHKVYLTSFTPAGEMVGIIAAQSMESFTQMTLNMFHSSGISEKNVTLGLPRLEEILNVTSNLKVIGFTFVPTIEYKTSDDLRNSLKLTEVRVGHLMKKTKILHVSEVVREPWQDYYDLLYTTEYQKCDWVVRITLKMDVLFKHSLTPMNVAVQLEKRLDSIFVVASPLNSDSYLDVYVDTSGIEDGNLTPIDAKRLYLTDIVIPTIFTLNISGIKGVLAVFPKEVDGHWIYEGNGGSFVDLLSHELCESTLTTIDNVCDIYDCLGIEAARSFLVDEITQIMGFDGTFTNPKHIMLLADRMCLNGKISSVNRHGMERDSFGPLAKAGFEETVYNLFQSGIHSEVDNLNGASASIMTGKAPSVGATGITDILVDTKKLESINEIDELDDMVSY
jgi:DNA-directed RNA polymerase II subunit RPB1